MSDDASTPCGPQMPDTDAHRAKPMIRSGHAIPSSGPDSARARTPIAQRPKGQRAPIGLLVSTCHGRLAQLVRAQPSHG